MFMELWTERLYSSGKLGSWSSNGLRFDSYLIMLASGEYYLTSLPLSFSTWPKVQHADS
jgi:hypothetical protein